MELNEEVKQKMIEYLQSFEAGVKTAAEFSAEQAPLVVQEYLAWIFFAKLAQCLLSLVALCVATYLGWKLSKKLYESDRIGLYIFGPFVGFVLSAFAIDGGYHAAKVAIAPRVVVLEKVSDIIGK